MRQHSRLASLCLIFTGLSFQWSIGWAQPSLTATESKWLDAARPVLEYGIELGLPIDVVVQPSSKTGDVPLAMGVRNSRCKLVFSMRGNEDAESTLASAPLSQHSMLIEAMAAHEIAHCWRYVHGVWHALPAGFTEPLDNGDSKEMAAKKHEMRATRREEGFADMVGLAWTLRAHPKNYEEVYAWFERIRQDQPLTGSFHDTRIWLSLVKQRDAFDAFATPFDQAQSLWVQGLRRDESSLN